ncbi:Proteasome component ECM29 [Golovinomyces cichoracearum]|uniref:Proteasome component ECM29 n=1 Tax=Golovinomyces cichoracearum TaxID=62708 RepID=A0A420HMM8_9PEZI|nr:Proteasome component ECM29 [Golovinomyces cichoracearum]
MSTETKELELCEKVEMRIALAKDDNLGGILETYLTPLLLKLKSEHFSVRNKVISICQHIKIRLAGNQQIILPVGSLLKQYKSNAGYPLLRQFNLMFIQQSVVKLSPKEQMDLVPEIIIGLAGDFGNTTCATMFNLFLRLLPQFKIPPRGSKEDSELRDQLGFNEHKDDTKFIGSWLGKLILLTLNRSTVNETACPSLTRAEYEFLTLNENQQTWDPNCDRGLNLTSTKIAALNFVSCGAFTDEERFLPALFATGDNDSRISSMGDDLLKRSTMSLEDPNLISYLVNLYFSLKPALQTRLLTLFSKSAVSTTYTSQIIKIVQQAIQPEDDSNLPAQGLETIKFRNALLNYMNWISRIATKEDSNCVAPHLVELLKNYIENQGWPVLHEKSTDSLSLRALAYETLGSLAKASSKTVLEESLSIVRWLFRSLTEERSSDEIFLSIEGALSSVLGIFVTSTDATLIYELRSVLLQYMTLEENDVIVRSACSTVVRWANQCLGYDDIVGRWIDIIAVGDNANQRKNVVEEGKKGLDPYLYQVLNSLPPSNVHLPNWEEMVKVFFTSKTMIENSSEANSLKTGMSIDSVSVFGNFPGSKIQSYATAVTYCQQMLLLNALQESNAQIFIDADWERKLDVIFHSDRDAQNLIRKFLRSIDQDTLYTYLTAAFEGMLFDYGKGLPGCSKCFVEILSVAPEELVGRFSERASQLTLVLESNNYDTRLHAARAYGILMPNPARANHIVENSIELLRLRISAWESVFGAEANKIHGYLLAIGFVLSNISYYRRSDILDSHLVKESISILLKILLGSGNNSTREAALNAVGQICAAGVLKASLLEELAPNTTQIIEVLSASAKKGDEKSISTLGRLSLVFDDDPIIAKETHSYLSSIMKNLYELFELKQVEIQFTIGEALTCLAACWESDFLILSKDIKTDYRGRLKRKETLGSLIYKLLKDCKNTKPSLRKASGIWLFSLIQYCGHLEEIQLRLRECQAAFMGLLSSRDELVQETASRGLSLVYEQGDTKLRESLVKDLVTSFTGSGPQLKVDEETELFEPGALPIGEGTSITSYKDIVSLANEVGDQSLVYKLMSLASNATTWSTRAAFGRFGLSNILSESEIDPKLYPKLYRYRFDPNQNVRRSMNDIWKALVKDSTTTINLYFHDIITDLLKNILGKEWRTRQASCAALADLVQGREFEKYEKYIHEIWHVAFKVLDDIKGSVREAARSLSIVLTNILVRQVESGTCSKDTQLMLQEVLPFLISEKGMESSAQDVRAFATITVVRIIKHGGKTLNPFIPDLIEKLLGLLSTIEPEEINYIYQRATEHRDKIDQIRSSAVSQSPLMEALERCLDSLDETTMKKLAPRLESSIKNLIGMPSKIGCAGVLSSLATRHSFLFKSYADSFLKAMENAVLDRNNAVSVAFAKTSGYISRLVSAHALSDFASYTRVLYFDSESENRRQISGEIIYAIAKYASDRFNSLASNFLPFVFFASHDYDAEVKKIFEKAWEENVGGSRIIMLYSNEIIKLSMECIESSKWITRHTAALCIANTIECSGSSLNEPVAAVIWPALEKALALKVFDGKEKVLKAFIKFVESGYSFWKNDQRITSQMKKIILREAKRNNEAYRLHSFDALGMFGEVQSKIDVFDDVYQIIAPFCEKYLSEDAMDLCDDQTEKSNREKHESAVLAAGISSLFRAVNCKVSDSMTLNQLSILVKIVTDIVFSMKLNVATRIVIYERTKCMFDGFRKHASRSNVSQYDLTWNFFTSLELQKDFGHESMRLKRAEACDSIIQAFRADVFGQSTDGRARCADQMRQILVQSKETELSEDVRTVLNKSLLALEQE